VVQQERHRDHPAESGAHAALDGLDDGENRRAAELEECPVHRPGGIGGPHRIDDLQELGCTR
jgi:hypothetical protein